MAVAVLFSIAAAQILFGAGLLALLLSRRKLEFPARLGLPLLAFAAWTLLSLAFSSHPADGLSQVRKLFLLFLPLLVYNAFRRRIEIRCSMQGVILGAGVAALYGLGQFAYRYVETVRAGTDFYASYVGARITGFMGHWLTFSGQLMLAALLAGSLLLAGWRGRGRVWERMCVALMTLALLASYTRGVWLGTLAGLLYLVWRFRPKLLWLVPAGLLLLFLVAPASLKERALSIFDAQADTSTRSRVVMFRTGLAMIAAHPWLGLGPERVGPEFLAYQPAGTELPPAYYGHLHNDYLQLAAERGIPCLLLWLWLLGEIVRQGFITARGEREWDRALGQGAVAATAALMVSGLFEYNFGDSEVLMLYLFLIAVPYAWARLREDAVPLERGSESQ